MKVFKNKHTFLESICIHVCVCVYVRTQKQITASKPRDRLECFFNKHT